MALSTLPFGKKISRGLVIYPVTPNGVEHDDSEVDDEPTDE